jgi:hypothetical protein
MMAEVTDAAALRAAGLENWDGQQDRTLIADDDVTAAYEVDRFDHALWDSIDETPGLGYVNGISTTSIVELDAGTPEEAEAARRLHEDDPRAGYRRACPRCHRTGCSDHEDGQGADQ